MATYPVPIQSAYYCHFPAHEYLLIISISPASYQITLENAIRNQSIPFTYIEHTTYTVCIILTPPCRQSKRQPKHPMPIQTI